MNPPSFELDEDGYPTDEQLGAVEKWPYEDCEGLAEYVCNLWHFENWAELRDWKKDEFGHEYRELRLATAGWSGNEDIVSALNKNMMFSMLCWQSSHRGGLHIYHIRKLTQKAS